ncbi:MAG: class I SAM-dependent methyltransferase [bacterium]|nr:class I SAM-dependent methyltransferase [bacterium]
MKRRDRNTTPATAAWRRWPPGAVALMAQAAAWVVAAPGLVLAWPTAVVLGIQAVAAFVVSRSLRQPLWWQLINAAFFPVIGLARHLTIHPGWYLAGFAVLALTSLGSLRTRVPLYLSSSAAVDAVVQRLPERPGLKVIDLGCGLGGWLLRLKAARPDLVASGVEMAPLNFLVSRLRLSRRAEVRLGSIWETDLSGYDVVYAYLSPAPMPRLWEKVRREMRPGSLFISNSFDVPGFPPDETVELHDLSRARLLVWRR